MFGLVGDVCGLIRPRASPCRTLQVLGEDGPDWEDAAAVRCHHRHDRGISLGESATHTPGGGGGTRRRGHREPQPSCFVDQRGHPAAAPQLRLLSCHFRVARF